MSRLIDADVLKEWLTTHCRLEFEPVLKKELLRLIDDQPTVLKLKEDEPEKDGLKRCPICGGKAILHGDTDSVFWVTCTQCRLDAAPSRYKSIAVKKWNDRIQKWYYKEDTQC